MATHSSILAWRIPWTEEPGRLWFIGSQRVGHDFSDSAHVHTNITDGRKLQRHDEQRQCGILDWILNRKSDVNAKLVNSQVCSLVNDTVPNVGFLVWSMYL